MAKRTNTQQVIINQLQLAKEKYDSETKLWERQLAQSREGLKQPIRELIDQAREAGIPMRQIHLDGLGFAQVNSLKQFIAQPKFGSASEEWDALLHPENGPSFTATVEKSEPTFTLKAAVETSNKTWTAIDKDGKAWEANLMGGDEFSRRKYFTVFDGRDILDFPREVLQSYLMAQPKAAIGSPIDGMDTEDVRSILDDDTYEGWE